MNSFVVLFAHLFSWCFKAIVFLIKKKSSNIALRLVYPHIWTQGVGDSLNVGRFPLFLLIGQVQSGAGLGWLYVDPDLAGSVPGSSGCRNEEIRWEKSGNSYDSFSP